VFWGIKPDAGQASASKHDAIQLTEFGRCARGGGSLLPSSYPGRRNCLFFE
jgi:hypothetical protein